MEKEYSTTQPEALEYKLLPDKVNVADVWLRRNITIEKDDEGHEMFVSDTVYFRTDKPEGDIDAHFDDYFFDPPEYHEPVPYTPPTIEERVQMQEDAITELAELLSDLLEG